MINQVPVQFFTIIEEFPNFYFQKYQLNIIFYQNPPTQLNIKVTELPLQNVMSDDYIKQKHNTVRLV